MSSVKVWKDPEVGKDQLFVRAMNDDDGAAAIFIVSKDGEPEQMGQLCFVSHDGKLDLCYDVPQDIADRAGIRLGGHHSHIETC